MNPDEIFNNCDKLPGSLTKTETYELFKKMHAGDKGAKEKLAHHNIKLVLNQVAKKFGNTGYDKKELVEVGCIGLVKAINTFDVSKEIEFSTYATPCIDNEIKNFFIKENKQIPTKSLSEIKKVGQEERDELLQDTITDGFNIEEDYYEKELKESLRNVIEELPEKEKKAIILYFGLKDNKPLVLADVAKEIDYSLSYTGVLIDKAVLKMANTLKAKGIIADTVYNKKKQKTKIKMV